MDTKRSEPFMATETRELIREFMARWDAAMNKARSLGLNDADAAEVVARYFRHQLQIREPLS